MRLFAAIAPKSSLSLPHKVIFIGANVPRAQITPNVASQLISCLKKSTENRQVPQQKHFSSPEIIKSSQPVAQRSPPPFQFVSNEKIPGFVVMVSMPMEQYVSAVLSAENGASKNDEALKAMAVAIRTYATRFHGQHAQDGFDFCDTTHCQTMKLSGVDSRNRAAVAGTSGEILFYKDAPAQAFYHANCGGTTAAASEAWARVSEPYLVVHSDTFCPIPGEVKWETTLSPEEIDGALAISGISPPENWRQSKSNRAPPANVSEFAISWWNSSALLANGLIFSFCNGS